MIGVIVLANAPFFDAKLNALSFKIRPFLVVGESDAGDYTMLPVSRITNKRNLDPNYDIEINPQTYPLLKLKALSYIRAHKATVVHKSAIDYKLGNMKFNYPDLYLEVIEKFEEYCKNLILNAI